jgi:isopenicillin N synthase-like dioxygenase
MQQIPLLDASQSDTALAADFARAFGEVGFAYIDNHGISNELRETVFAASARLHALPHATKMAIALDHNHRGYIPINTSTDVNSKLVEVTKPNQSASFMMMREDKAETDAYLSGPNQWPNLAEFKEDVTAYHDALTALGHRLMRIAALSLGAQPDAFAPSFAPPTTWLRLLHYPAAPANRPDDLYGSAPHTDFGCLTILAQDDAGGLQVQTPTGEWIDAPPRPGAFIVNVGDMLHRWSNGQLRSTPHRVINQSGRARYSCPFFFDPHVSACIAPLPTCVTVDRPAAWPTIAFGDFLRAELTASYDQHNTSSP